MKVGQAVMVNYQDMDGSHHAALIRAIPSAGSAGGSIATASSLRRRRTAS